MANSSDILARPIRDSGQNSLFEFEDAWRDEWLGMPEFSMGDASPQYRITINFMTPEDVRDFAEKVGIPVTTRSDSAWFPHQKPLNGQMEYRGPKTDSRYPVCIPSKGRWEVQKTGKALDSLGVSYKFFVEKEEGAKYTARYGRDHVEVMPFSNLGQGSVPARNYIWEWAKERGFRRHWVIDDNIVSFARLNNNRRLCVRGGGFFQAMEDFVDRYENVAMAGPHHKGFVPDRSDKVGPYLLNSRIYSCILIDTDLPFRWRGRYNEDTDLSLRVLKAGYCTLLFRALLMDKSGTAKGMGNSGTSGKPMIGGNTDNVYNQNDYRLAFAKSLEEQHPDCVQTMWKFGRFHHQVDYSQFKKNKLIRNPGKVLPLEYNNYNMTLHQTETE